MSGDVSGVDALLALAAQAKSGELVLDPEVAVECTAATQEAIERLLKVQNRMSGQAGLLPLGNFDCGHSLAQILSEVTQQHNDRLAEHIACLRAIHDMVGAQVAETLTTDEETGQSLARVNGQIAS